ncbi:PfkB family carbohydrate kinase [Streptomyces djakartensis]|uniref:PfkB family carbohydrate kinase n=1 Tax=Streptomyces djakartensis TaxID=68193 RepID=UPI001E5CBA0E|nr:PfkB family carbohydrate kinase [Streptomyces djakartensis]
MVVKRGARGATGFTAGGTTDRPARQVDAVDLVGAGDAFVAGYLSGLLDGADATPVCTGPSPPRRSPSPPGATGRAFPRGTNSACSTSPTARPFAEPGNVVIGTVSPAQFRTGETSRWQLPGSDRRVRSTVLALAAMAWLRVSARWPLTRPGGRR